jgi:hypothetical protein
MLSVPCCRQLAFAKARARTNGTGCSVVYRGGFDVSVDRCCGGVLVRWWYPSSATPTQAEVLAHLTWYADAIRAMGWTVETHYCRLPDAPLQPRL